MRQLTITGVVTFLAAATAAACTGGVTGDRPEPPLLQVLTPERGTTRPDLTQIEVRGTVAPSPDSAAAIATVLVNGVVAQVSDTGDFRATIPLGAGTNLIKTVATDTSGGVASDTRGFLTGSLRPLDLVVDNAMAAGLSAAAFDKLGDTAATLVAQADLGSFVAPFNPVIAKGLTDGEEDCLYGKASVLPGLDLANAFISLAPNNAGLTLDAELVGLVIPLHARYAAACLDGDTDITVRAQRARIRGNLAITIVGGRFDVKLVNPTVTLTGFDLDASGVPGAVIDLLNLDDEVAKTLAWAVERFMAPMVNQALAGVSVADPSVDLLGHTMIIDLAPAGVAFDSAGAEVVLDAAMTVTDGTTSFVYTENQLPPQRGDAGFALAVADDVLNQALAGFWSAGAMGMTVEKELGMYDAIRLDPLLPPVVSATPDGALRLVMADLMVELSAGGVVSTKLAMTVEMTLKIEPAANSYAARISVELPTLSADIIENTLGIPDSELEKLFPGMIESTIGTFAPILNAVPLPSLYGISVSDLHLGSGQGYVTVSGSLN
jgi:hypothetical protein